MVELSNGAFAGVIIGVVLFCIIVTGVLTFFLTRRMFEKQIKENPPITEKMVRAMFLQMGRKASEKQIKAVMRSMTNAKNEK